MKMIYNFYLTISNKFVFIFINNRQETYHE